MCSTRADADRRSLASNRTDLLAAALAHLATYTHVLIYEDLANLPKYLAAAFGCHNVSVPSRVYFSGRPRGPRSAPPSTWLSVAAQRNELDTLVYEAGRRMYWRSWHRLGHRNRSLAQ